MKCSRKLNTNIKNTYKLCFFYGCACVSIIHNFIILKVCNIATISIWILEILPTACFVRSQSFEPNLIKSVHSWVHVDICAECNEINIYIYHAHEKVTDNQNAASHGKKTKQNTYCTVNISLKNDIYVRFLSLMEKTHHYVFNQLL